MTTGQKVPAGYYVSNSKDEDVFFVDPKGNYYFKKETGKLSDPLPRCKWSQPDRRLAACRPRGPNIFPGYRTSL